VAAESTLEDAMKTISAKVTDSFDVELTGMAKRHGMSKSALIREALETYLRAGRSRGNGSAMALADDLAGIVAGPEDLSVNKRHLQKFGG
jgi:predicted transcriptional regulator